MQAARIFNILFVISWFFGIERRPVVNGLASLISFLKPVAVSVAPLRPPPPFSAMQTSLAELALYSLTERATSPFHAEPGTAHSRGAIFSAASLEVITG